MDQDNKKPKIMTAADYAKIPVSSFEDEAMNALAAKLMANGQEAASPKTPSPRSPKTTPRGMNFK